MDKLKLHTPNRANDNFAKLSALFPNAVTETINEQGELVRAIDKDILMQEISTSVVEGREERYQFTWPDKKKSILLANAPINKTLRPCREESVDFDNTENLYIEGDNLEVLKLLQETYLGKVKMIYIDPPYNTGNDFVYEDDFAQSMDEYMENSGQYDEDGNRLFKNMDSNGRFHTDWLNMIYPRLKLARDLLTDDGVIFISIDDNEVENLKKICNEIFGADNFIGNIIIKSNPRGSMSTSEIANLHEYLILFTKNINIANIIGHPLTDDMIAEYKYKDEKGMYRLLGLRMRGGFWRRIERPNLYFPLYVNTQSGEVSLKKINGFDEEVFPIQPSTMEEGTWRWSKERIAQNLDLLIGKTVMRENQVFWDISQKDYHERNEGRRTKAKSIWDSKEINYQNGTVDLKVNLGKSGIFDYSKPVYLLNQALTMIKYEPNDIILDFFSGSATTAHAVMQLNAEDGGNRKFIMVQLPELTDEKSEAYKAGYKNICEIGKERIRRAGQKIKAEIEENNAQLKLGEEPKKVPDVGFRVLKCDSSNMKDIYYYPEETEVTMFDNLINNIKEDRTPQDLLMQVMLDLGVLLSSKITESEIGGKKVFSVDDDYLIACFDSNITNDIIEQIAKKKPYYFVMRDSSLQDSSVAVNFEQLFKAYSPDTVRMVL